MTKKVAVILSGCGFLDGAEIRESVLTLLNLDMSGADVSMFAPNKSQHHVVDHKKGEEAGDTRNILEESARIARGKIEDLENLKTDDYDALVLPGGFGVAKNLCDFAFKGSGGSVDDTVLRVIKEFHQKGKAIGAICISPALVAMCLGETGLKLTIGTDKETVAEIEKTGAKHVECQAGDCVIDIEQKVVSTPAYMFDDASITAINSGIGKCIREVLAF